MHNLDRVMLELNEDAMEAYDEDEGGYEAGEGHEHEGACARCGHAQGEDEGTYEEEEEEYPGEALSEEEVLEFAAEFLELSEDEQLDEFFKKLFSKIGRGLKSFARSRVGRAIGGFLKGAAKTILPMAGTALGGLVGGPVGARIGGALGNVAGGAISGGGRGARGALRQIPGIEQAAASFGIQLEGMSEEDQRFEVAQRFVRFSGDAIQRAMAQAEELSDEETGEVQDPMAIARAAFRQAAETHAPGFLARPSARSLAQRALPRSGRWVRQGSRIILLGL